MVSMTQGQEKKALFYRYHFLSGLSYYILFSYAFLSLCFILSGAVHAETLIKNIRFGKQGALTRVVLDLSADIKPTVFLLGSPARIVIDFDQARYSNAAKIAPAGVVAGYRHGLFDEDTYRLVLDLKKEAIIAAEFSLEPSGAYGYRYVIDLEPSGGQRFAEAVALSKASLLSKKSTAKSSVPQKQDAGVKEPGLKKLIVLDPGHGGPDPGTLGVLGVNEEHIVLNIAKEVKKLLEATGRYEVRLTRDKDIYLRHRKRFEMARDMNADLFISIHADSIADPRVRGGTVYTLNEAASDREAARLAARENKSDALAGVDLSSADDDVSGILIDLAQRQTMNISASFAEVLVASMREEVKMHSQGHRFASLLVLKSPDIPSVLVETGYLSNKEDAKLLNSADGKARIARGILKGVDRFFQQTETRAR